LEALGKHIPRRQILSSLAQSEEARARPQSAALLPTSEVADRRSTFKRFTDRIMTTSRELLKQIILSRFDSIDYKLTFILQEMNAQNVAVSQKIDDSFWILSDKLDSSFRALNTSQAAMESATERRYEDLLRQRAVRVVQIDGFLLGVPSEEWRLAAYLEYRGDLEPGLMKFFGSIVQPGMVVVDVGANLGRMTLCAARILEGTGGRVHSFEPTPRTHELLRNNIQINGYLESGVVQFHREAVADIQGESKLTVFPDRSGLNTLFWPDDGTETVLVRTISLDEALREERRIDVVKIDVEGAELLVMRGMKRIVERNPDIRIVLEFAPTHLRRAGVSPEAFLQEITSVGFRITRINDISGILQEVSVGELLGSFSANIHLQQARSDGLAHDRGTAEHKE
jgi:FkbM family methyltransferase